MDIAKITQNTVNIAQNTLNHSAKINTMPTTLKCPEKLMDTLNCLAANTVSTIKPAKKTNIPEFIYHITSEENYEKILHDKKIIKSTIETGQNACYGIYFLDKDNFLQKWLGRKEPDLSGDVDIGEALMAWTCKGNNPVIIKIPTSRLDLSKLRFRPYLEACKESFEKLNSDTMKVDSKLVTEGLPLSDLQRYIKTNEPIEFIYKEELPIDIIDSFFTTKFTENMRDMISKLFA